MALPKKIPTATALPVEPAAPIAAQAQAAATPTAAPAATRAPAPAQPLPVAPSPVAPMAPPAAPSRGAGQPPRQPPISKQASTADMWSSLLAGQGAGAPALTSTSASLGAGKSPDAMTAAHDQATAGLDTETGSGANSTGLNLPPPNATLWEPDIVATTPDPTDVLLSGTPDPDPDAEGTDDPPTDAEGGTYEGDASEMWSGMMADYDASLEGKLQGTYADEARAGRQADVQSAMLGQGVSGGGAQAGQAQVALGGMQQRLNTRNEHTKQGLTMKLTYLDTLIKRAEASKDRALQDKLEAERNATMLLIATGGQGGEPGAGAGGGSGAADGASIDDQLTQTFNGSNGWTSINEGIKSEGWSRAQIDSAKKFSADYYEQNGQWPSLDTIKKYGLAGQTTTSAGASNGIPGAVLGNNYDETGQEV